MKGQGRVFGSQPRRRLKGRIALIVFVLFIGWLGLNYYLSNYVLQVTRLDMALTRLPRAFDGFVIAHLSDWHGERFGQDNRDLTDILRREHPDLIALTGDFVETTDGLPALETLCAQLMQIAPTYYVTGNHEWACRAVPALKEIFRKTGVIYLDNAFVDLTLRGERICLVGLEDPNGWKESPSPAEVMTRARAGRDIFTLVLSHRYDRMEIYADIGADLALAGHAHGGMIRLPFTDGLIGPGRQWFPQHTSGVIRQGDTAMVVSRGLGSGRSDFPFSFRLFNQPEIVMVTLRCP